MKNNVIDHMTDKGKEKGDITMEKVYTFRELKSTDTFLMFNIISKIGITDLAESFDIDELQNMVKGGDNATKTLGISIILKLANIILTNLPKCDTEIFKLLSDTSNLTVEQVRDLDFTTFTKMVIDFIKKEEFKDFIKVVSESFKSEN